MIIYIVLDNSKDCYDAGGVYDSAHMTREDAEERLSVFSKYDRSSFEIVEEEI